jgi:uncharacterized protein YndB with AHSA1/START domain
MGKAADVGGNAREAPVTETCRIINTTPERIFAVLADGWSYASWVVGAAHIRSVDADWPAVGTRIHHRVGPWPLQINDQTSVRTVEPDSVLELNAQMWPLGAGIVRIWLEPLSSASTRVHMAETLTSGIGRVLPDAVQALLLRPRNAEALQRLDDIAVHRESR